MAHYVKSLALFVALLFSIVHAQSAQSRQSVEHIIALVQAVSEGHISIDQAPTKKQLSRTVFELESFALCNRVLCDFEHAVFDPEVAKCICPWARFSVMEMALTRADRTCQLRAPCPYPFRSVSDASQTGCICTVLPLPPSGNVHPYLHAPAGTPEHLRLSRGWWMRQGMPGNRAYVARLLAGDGKLPGHLHLQQRHSLNAVPNTPALSHVPPPKPQLTRQQLKNTMAIQPDQAAIVTSIVPHFTEGIITFFIQLQGPVAQTILLNATDTLPCDTIGLTPQPNIVLAPRTTSNETVEITIPDCSIFAVNMYNSSHIRYWVTKPDNSIFMLVGDNKIQGVDQLDPSASVALSIRAVQTSDVVKRAFGQPAITTPPLERHQLLAAPCDSPCPHMNMVKTATVSSLNLCGCTFFRQDDSKSSLTARAVETADAYNAIMTLETCRSITCLNNGGKPALFNPFSKTCWCTGPAYVDVNSSAYVGGD